MRWGSERNDPAPHSPGNVQLVEMASGKYSCSRRIRSCRFSGDAQNYPLFEKQSERQTACQRRFSAALRGRSRQIKHFLKEWAGAGLYSMADALLRKMSGARERQSGRRIRFIFCAFILLRLYLAGNIGLLFRKVQSHCAEMASDTKRPCRSEQRQLSVLIRQGPSDGPDEAEAVSTLTRSLAPTPLTVTPQIF